MKKKWRMFLLLCFICITLPCYPKGESHIIQDVPLFAQQTSLWCWAAGGEMIMHKLGKDVPQSVQAALNPNCNDCRSKPITEEYCACSGFANYRHFGFEYCSTNFTRKPPLLWDTLVSQIKDDKPVGFSWGWKNSSSKASGHYMVVRGYIQIDDYRMLVVNDPKPSNPEKDKGGTLIIMTYKDYKAFPRRYEHRYDDYNFREKSKPENKKSNVKSMHMKNKTPATTGIERAPEDIGEQEPGALLPGLLQLLQTLPLEAKELLGFKPKHEGKKIEWRGPLDIKNVGLLDLAKCDPADLKSIKEILMYGKEKIYLLYIEKEFITTLTIRKRKGKWVFSAFGNKKKEMMRKANTLYHISKSFYQSSVIIDVPAMYLTFLASWKDKGTAKEELKMELPYESPVFSSQWTERLHAQDFFKKLKEKAPKYENVLTPPPKEN